MKKFIMILTTALLGLMVGCSTYNDSRVWEAIEELEVQVSNQQALLLALSNNLTIYSITETNEGFVITFSDNTTITIKHGEDGKDGTDGEDGKDGEGGTSVIVSVTWDDQNAYFTLSDGSVITIPLSTLGEEEEVSEDNKIYYTSADGDKIFPYQAGHAAFDAVLLSNTYKNGMGCMTFDDKVTQMTGVFRDSYLTSITLPKSMEQIAWYAFANCLYLEEITIPENVYWLNNAVFDGCANLKRIYCTPTTPPQLGENPLGAIPADLKIYVPKNYLDDYLATSWSAYADYLVEYDSEAVSANYEAWLGNWTVKGEGLEYVAGQGYVNPVQVEFNVSITKATENESFWVDGWNGFAGLPILVEYDVEHDALIFAAGVVATDVKFSDGQVALQIILAGVANDGFMYAGVEDMAYAIRSGEGAVIAPFEYTLQDGSEFYYTHTVFFGDFEDGRYLLEDCIPSTTLTMTPMASSATLAPSKTAIGPSKHHKAGDVKLRSINF